MNDADQQRLEQIRAKLRRIAGHRELSDKQIESVCALVQELESLIGGSPIEEVFKWR